MKSFLFNQKTGFAYVSIIVVIISLLSLLININPLIPLVILGGLGLYWLIYLLKNDVPLLILLGASLFLLLMVALGIFHPLPLILLGGIWLFWAFYLWKKDKQHAKKTFLKVLLGSVFSVGLTVLLYKSMEVYFMQDRQLQHSTIFAKACGDMSPNAPDAWQCDEDSCRINNGFIYHTQGETWEIVERDFRFGQPVLYVRLPNESKVNRYCLK